MTIDSDLPGSQAGASFPKRLRVLSVLVCRCIPLCHVLHCPSLGTCLPVRLTRQGQRATAAKSKAQRARPKLSPPEPTKVSPKAKPSARVNKVSPKAKASPKRPSPKAKASPKGSPKAKASPKGSSKAKASGKREKTSPKAKATGKRIRKPKADATTKAPKALKDSWNNRYSRAYHQAKRAGCDKKEVGSLDLDTLSP